MYNRKTSVTTETSKSGVKEVNRFKKYNVCLFDSEILSHSKVSSTYPDFSGLRVWSRG